LIDVTGKVIESTKIPETSQFQIDLTSYNKGIYFLRIEGENKVFTNRIIKQ